MEQKNISFGKGIHRSPSISLDNGELSECVNLIPRNGELVNIQPPIKTVTAPDGSKVAITIPEDGKLLCIHHVSDVDHYIYQKTVSANGAISDALAKGSITPDFEGLEETTTIYFCKTSCIGYNNLHKYRWASDKVLSSAISYSATEKDNGTDESTATWFGGESSYIYTGYSLPAGADRGLLLVHSFSSESFSNKYEYHPYVMVADCFDVEFSADNIVFTELTEEEFNTRFPAHDKSDNILFMCIKDYQTVIIADGAYSYTAKSGTGYGIPLSPLDEDTTIVYSVSDSYTGQHSDTRQDWLDAQTIPHEFHLARGWEGGYIASAMEYKSINAMPTGYPSSGASVAINYLDTFSISFSETDSDIKASVVDEDTYNKLLGGEKGASILFYISTDAPKVYNLIGCFGAIKQIQPMGGTLSIIYSDSTPMGWLIWKADSKMYARKNKIPQIDLDFSLSMSLKKYDSTLGVVSIAETSGLDDDNFVIRWRSPVYSRQDNYKLQNYVNLRLKDMVGSGINEGEKIYIKNNTQYTLCILRQHFNSGTFGDSDDFENEYGSIKPNEIWKTTDSGADAGLVFDPSKDDHFLIYRGTKIYDESTEWGYRWSGQILVGCFESSEGVSNVKVENTQENYEAIQGALDTYRTDLNKDNYFVDPFFVSYGYKLFDGSIVNVSPPRLMVPAWGANPIMLHNAKEAVASAQVTMYAMAGKLFIRFLDIPEDLANWSDTIHSIVIAISTPCERYSWASAWDEETNKVLNYSLSTTHFDTDNYIGLGEYDNVYKKAKESADFQFQQLMGIKELEDDDRKSDMLEKVASRYIIKEYMLKELEDISQDWAEVPIKDGYLEETTLKTLKTIDTDATALSFRSLHPQVITAYNKRIVIGNVGSEYLPVRSCSSPQLWDSTDYQGEVRVIVYIDQDSQEVCVDSGWQTCYNPFCWLFFPDEKAKRFIVFKHKTAALPDPENISRPYALKSYTYIKKEGTFTRHSVINGAYYISTVLDNDEGFTECTEEEACAEYASDGFIQEPNALYNSKAGNPMTFDLANSYAVGQGTILGLSTTGKAMSSGSSFGQYPMYCFCTDGVWPLSVASDGGFGAPNPATRDVCNNIDSIAQADGALVFSTQEGLKVLTGQETTLITDVLRGYNISEEKFFKDLSAHQSLIAEDTNSIADIVSGCICVADYAHRLIHLYPKSPVYSNSGDTYKHYAYSIDDKEWSTVVDGDSYIITAIPGYPYTVMQRDDGVLMEYTDAEQLYDDSDEPIFRDGILLTRPVAFDNPVALKVLADLRLFYTKLTAENGEKAKCYIQVFVSNDRNTWMPLRSLHAHAYKWYRFRVRTHLRDTDALTALVCMTEERRTNKIR